MSPEETSVLIYFFSILFCAISFFAIGIYAFVIKTPIHFYSGTKVPAEYITDIKKYNRANGIMWLVFSVPFFANAIIGLFNIILAAFILMISFIVGIPALIFTYKAIYKQFSKK